MTNSRHNPLPPYVRFLLIVVGLILLQCNVPVQSCSDLQICADFEVSEPKPFKLFKLYQESLACAASNFSSFSEHMQSCLATQAGFGNKSKSFKIVKVTSIQTVAKDLWPVKGSISSGYGMRRHPITRRNSFHNGIDIRARQGTSILSPADGVVVSAGRAGLLGRLVKIKTNGGKTLYFGHMHKISCHKGDRIKPGQLIGTVGSSGRATGPHLHFSVVSAGRYINPLTYLAAD